MTTGFAAIDALPSLNEFKNERDLPASPVAGVYLLLAESAIVYIGQSQNIRQRLRDHRREGKKRFDHAVWYPIPDKMSRLLTEGILILAELPMYNRQVALGLSGGKAWELPLHGLSWGKGRRPSYIPTSLVPPEYDEDPAGKRASRLDTLESRLPVQKPAKRGRGRA